MKTVFTVVCRGSWLSMAQVALFQAKIALHFPLVKLNILIKETRGDKEQSTPLHLIPGKDFFTAEIQEDLLNGKADFAVHSMKDVSGDHFFEQSFYQILERDDLRDVAIFNASVLDKIKNGESIIIGTSSPRRTVMATSFLQKALPQLSEAPIVIEAKPIRGNVDGRLRKLSNNKEFDGIILAVAGLNRLLNFQDSKETIQQFLLDKKIMVLPLFECPPAAGQGAIVAETSKHNLEAIEILKKISDIEITNSVKQERIVATKYGYGCSQQFGVFHLDNVNSSFTYAAGVDGEGNSFTEWNYTLPSFKSDAKIFAGTDFMKSFFTDTFLDYTKIETSTKALFVTSHKALHSPSLLMQASKKRVLVAGNKTWMALAQKGIWVEASADGLGLFSILPLLNSPLIQLQKKQISIITNNNSVVSWLSDGWNAIASYTLHPILNETIIAQIADADFIFWASYQQYQIAHQFVKSGVQHACPSGKTATLLQQQGLKPFIFPTIKAFITWRANHISATNGA